MKVTYIKLLGEEHPLCFSLSAVEEISNTFGSMEEMQEIILNDGMTGEKMRAIASLLDILIKAGRRYFKLMDLELPKEIKGSVADLIDIRDPDALNKVFEAIAGDTEREVEATSKNAEAMPE
jgi:hypothetical protein